MMDKELRYMERTSCNLRAFIPVQGDPMEVEVDCRPKDVRDPSAVVLLGFEEPISVLD
jgi:hypothetical protein